MLPSNRWYPVLQRYISYCSDRVAGLGGNPNAIPPSVNGAPVKVIGGKKEKSYSGKICEIVFNCFGDFEGFVLETCEGPVSFKSCEKAILEICLRACKDRLSLSVYIDEKRKITRIVVHCCC